MAVWPAQLVKIRAGQRGSGWAVGAFGVLTARHVIESHLTDPTGVRCRMVTGGRAGSETFDGTAIWHDQDRDLALLAVVEHQRPAWQDRLADHGPTVLADVGEEPVREVSVIGFPDALVDQDAKRSDPDQAEGTLLPAAGGAGLVAFDVATSVPADSLLWQGMSGAVVRETGPAVPRLLAVIAQRAPDRASRRLFAAELPDPERDPDWAAALQQVGAPAVVEDFHAPEARKFLLAADPAGRPWRVRDVPELRMFGVRRAREDVAPTAQPYFPFLDRAEAADVRDAVDRALDSTGTGPRMVVLVGDSAAGKSRLAAEVVQNHLALATHRLIRPSAEEKLRDLPAVFGRRGRVVFWLDDLDKYLAGDLSTRVVEDLLSNPQALIVATLRSDRLQALAVEDYASPAHDLLTNTELMVQVPITNRPDWLGFTSGTASQVRDTELMGEALAAADAAGVGLGEYLAAFQLLRLRYQSAGPWAKTLIDALADWAGTGINLPLRREEAWELSVQTTPDPQRLEWETAPDARRAQIIEEAFGYATKPVLASTALVSETRSGVFANELAQLERADQPVPEPIWAYAARTAETVPDLLWVVALQAALAGQIDVAQHLWKSEADRGNRVAMSNLGALLMDTSPAAARTWFEQAANLGDLDAMFNLGVMLQDSDSAAARTAYERGANHGDPDAMNNLGRMLQTSDPEVARGWYRQAAAQGHLDAMVNLGFLLEESDPEAAGSWYRLAATRGDPGAMVALGLLLLDGAPEAAITWFERAAEHGSVDAMRNLEILLEESDPAAASAWHERASRLMSDE